MELPIGATVVCRDGKAGKLHYVVISKADLEATLRDLLTRFRDSGAYGTEQIALFAEAGAVLGYHRRAGHTADAAGRLE